MSILEGLPLPGAIDLCEEHPEHHEYIDPNGFLTAVWNVLHELRPVLRDDHPLPIESNIFFQRCLEDPGFERLLECFTQNIKHVHHKERDEYRRHAVHTLADYYMAVDNEQRGNLLRDVAEEVRSIRRKSILLSDE